MAVSPAFFGAVFEERLRIRFLAAANLVDEDMIG
jgi:hypothetical protein